MEKGGLDLCEGEGELREGEKQESEVNRYTIEWPPFAFTASCVGLGEFPLLLQSRIPAHHSDDDGGMVHHVLQVRWLSVGCGCVWLKKRDKAGGGGGHHEGGCYLSASS